MLFEVRRTTTQVGTFIADTASEALTLAKEKFERPFHDRQAEFTIRELREELGGIPAAVSERAAETTERRR